MRKVEWISSILESEATFSSASKIENFWSTGSPKIPPSSFSWAFFPPPFGTPVHLWLPVILQVLLDHTENNYRKRKLKFFRRFREKTLNSTYSSDQLCICYSICQLLDYLNNKSTCTQHKGKKVCQRDQIQRTTVLKTFYYETQRGFLKIKKCNN